LLDNSLNTSVSQTVQLTGLGAGSTQQTITYAPISASPVVWSALAVSATASSGLPVTLSSLTNSTCQLNGTNLSIESPGICTIQAYQAGNTVYAPATATLNITINLISQTITFPS